MPATPQLAEAPAASDVFRLRDVSDGKEKVITYSDLVSALTTAIAAKISSSLIGAANGVCGLDAGSKVATGNIPTLSYAASVHTHASTDITGLAASATTDATNASNIGSGTLGSGRLPAFGSGDVSFASGGGAGTIAAAAVSLAKMANLAANSIMGNNTGSAATPLALTVAQVLTLLGIGQQAQAFATAETSVSAAAYADVTGVSISLAAGTWLLMATITGRAANLAFLMHAALTDNANAVVSEASQFVPASGSASVNALGCIALSAIVAPVSTTTYKLRAARGNTTLTNTWSAVDGSGVGVTNNASSNTDKGTGIRAIRIL